MALNDYRTMKKKAVIKHRAKSYTEALYFAVNIERG